MAMTDETRSMLEIASGGLLIEAAGGIAVIVFAIIGLAHGSDGFTISIATIVLGVALLAEGGTIAARFSKLLVADGRETRRREISASSVSRTRPDQG